MVGLRPRDTTAQDAQKIKKPFDEEYRPTYLPPGLINHGNTCFMNSVLQGLISTRILADLIQFAPLPPVASSVATLPIASRRSPQITNQHGLGGQYEQPWTPGMPIGDVFVTLMLKAWKVQQSRRRENMSPRELLSAIGRKYEQYMDFAQQDAHEFLRQLLDAMRMEELDIIKKRQPPPSPSQDKRRRRSTLKPPSSPSLIPPQDSTTPTLLSPISPPRPSPESEGDKLTTFVDMIFGGKLTSILVCEKCKHISQTQEDFNDLSLSIKPDDYGKDRKRGRFKAFARRVAALQSATLGTHSSEKHRSSSVPPSPREVAKFAGGIDGPLLVADPRRRSLDILAALGPQDRAMAGKRSATRETSPERDILHSSSASMVEDVEDSKHVTEGVKADKKGKKDKEDDSWAKFGRRISMSIRLGKDKERRGRSRDRVSVVEVRDTQNSKSKEIEDATSLGAVYSTTSSSASDVRHDLVPPEAHSPPEFVPEKPTILTRHSDFGPKMISPPLLIQPSLSVSRIPTIHHTSGKRLRSSQPPKPTPEETAYLRQILADITPASSSPFAIFRNSHQFGTNGVTPSSSSTSAYALWMKMGQLPGIEECLRMFTAVEILDGENMVGCRQCWKIANGVYKRPPPSQGEFGEDDSDSEDNKPGDGEVWREASKVEQPSPVHPNHSFTSPASFSSPTLSMSVQTNFTNVAPKTSPPTRETTPFSFASGPKLYPPSLIFQNDNTAQLTLPEFDKSLPITPISTPPPETILPLPTGARPPVIFNPQNSVESLEVPALDLPVISIPSISTTGPESPTFTPLAELPDGSKDALKPLQSPGTPPSDSLRTPRVQHKRPKESDFFDGNCESSEADSDASTGTSLFDQSANSSPSFLSPDLPTEGSAHSKESSSSSYKLKRSKEVIMRAAYKRYLIGTPPPVLVIHLKRFQQVSKSHRMSFSHGLKKLDDYVTFPEYLDLTPFLAPKKEDFGLGSKRLSARLRPKDKERCMYRLYAVVVHIGNMLGGHYVAYTALPVTSPSVRSPQPASTSPASPETNSTTSNANSKAPRQWAYISDTMVRLTTIEEVLKVKAYICMYERI